MKSNYVNEILGRTSPHRERYTSVGPCARLMASSNDDGCWFFGLSKQNILIDSFLLFVSFITLVLPVPYFKTNGTELQATSTSRDPPIVPQSPSYVKERLTMNAEKLRGTCHRIHTCCLSYLVNIFGEGIQSNSIGHGNDLYAKQINTSAVGSSRPPCAIPILSSAL